MAETASQSAMLSSFSVGEALTKGWQFFQVNVSKMVVLGAIYLVASIVPSYAVQMLAEDNSSLASLLSLALNVWGMYLTLGMTRYVLSLVRGGNPEVSTIFNNVDSLVNYLIMKIRYFIVIFGGLLLLVIPGIYFSLKYGFTLMLVADGKANGSEAFKMSAQMTEGRRLTLFVYAVASALLVGVGMILLVVPGILAGVVAGVGMVFLYSKTCHSYSFDVHQRTTFERRFFIFDFTLSTGVIFG